MLVVLILYLFSIVVENVQAAQFTLCAALNYCIGNYLAVFWCTTMNDRQCAFAVAQNAPQATAFTYYPGNSSCYAHVNATIANVVAHGTADPKQSICSFYTQQVSATQCNSIM